MKGRRDYKSVSRTPAVKKREYPEFVLQTQICKWLKMQHPGVHFMSDTVANLELTDQQKGRNSKIQDSGFHCPDLMIYAVRGRYAGLFIELKAESPYYKSHPDKLKKNKHVEDQAQTIEELRKEGYFACFAWEFTQITNLINRYLSLPKPIIPDVRF
jgi:hypothetical protein